MFDRGSKELVLNGNRESILEFAVWFQTPFGLFNKYEDAVLRLFAADMDIDTCLKPVSIAITESSYEVIG